MAFQMKVSDLLLNEFEVIKKIVGGQSELISLYSSYVPRLVNRLERYFKMINKDGEMLDNIVEVLDKYSLVYAKSVVMDTLEKSKSHDFKPLRQNEEQIKIYKEEIEQIKQLEQHGAKQLAFALLITSKVRTVRYADPTIHLGNIIDIQRLCGKLRSKEEVYFLLHDLAKAEMVTVPLIEDKLTINFTKYEGEVEYTLTNTDVLDLLSVFNKVAGEYRREQQKYILEIALDSDYHTIHESQNEASRVSKVPACSIRQVVKLNRMSAGGRTFVELDFEDIDNTEYINNICKFMRTYVKKHYRKLKKRGVKWVISRDFMGAVCQTTGEVLVEM